MSLYGNRLRRLEAALTLRGDCNCQGNNTIIWCEATETREQFDGALERVRQSPQCPVHPVRPLLIVRIAGAPRQAPRL